MGLFSDLISLPFKVAGGVVQGVGEVTDTNKITDIVSKPLDAIGKAVEDLDI